MMKFFKYLSMHFGVRFDIGGMLYWPRNQLPPPLLFEMCYENSRPWNHWSANEIPCARSYCWLEWTWFICCQRYSFSEKGLWHFWRLFSTFFDRVWHCSWRQKNSFLNYDIVVHAYKKISKKKLDRYFLYFQCCTYAGLDCTGQFEAYNVT